MKSKVSLNIKNTLSIVFLMLSWNLISGNLGALSPILYRHIAFLILIFILLIYLQEFRVVCGISDLGGVGIIALGLVMFFSSLSKEYWLISFPLVLYGLAICLNKSMIFLTFSAAGTIYAAFFIIQQYIPSVHYLISKVSLEFSHSISTFAGNSIVLGSYAGGFWVMITFFCAIISMFIFSDSKINSPKFIKSIVGLILCYIVYIFILVNFILDGAYAINSQFIIFLLCLVPLFYCINGIEILYPITLVHARRNNWIICLFFVSIVLIVIFSHLAVPTTAKCNIVFYERNCAIEFDPIKFPENNETLGLIGRRPAAGGLLLFIEKAGYKLTHFGTQTNQTLEEVLRSADILIIANLEKPLTNKELNAIWSFVRRGGGLLLFADHTSVFVNDTEFHEGKDYFNNILAPTGIRINPDTADWIITDKTWIRGSWAYPLDILPHPLTYRISHQELDSVSVGASLNLTGTAKPIVMAPWGFSDNAIPSNEGHLGNRIYDHGEQIGDIVLVAEDSYGEGKVLVFGDTSYILETELPFTYALLRNIFSWLASSSTLSGIIVSSQLGLSALGLVALASLIYLISHKEMLVIILCPVIIAMSLSVAGFTNDLVAEEMTPIGSVAWIDQSHNNLASFKGAQDDSINGLLVNLMRNGYVPLIANDLSEITDGNVLVIIGPTKKYTLSEADTIKNFVYSGGILVLSVGYSESESVDLILNEFDLSIVNIPLGSYPWVIDYHTGGNLSQENLETYWHRPKFMEVYPVLCECNYIPYSSISYKDRKFDLIIGKLYGNGAIVLIGDSRFLLDENLERLSDPAIVVPQYKLQWVGNIEILRGIFSDLKERGVSI